MVRLEAHEADPGAPPAVVGPRERLRGAHRETADPRCRSCPRRSRARSGSPSACTGRTAIRPEHSPMPASSATEAGGDPAGGGSVTAGRLGPLLHRGPGVGPEVAEAVPALDRVVLDLLGAVGALLHGRPLDRRAGERAKGYPETEEAGRARARLFGRDVPSAHMSDEPDGGIPPLGGGALGGWRARRHAAARRWAAGRGVPPPIVPPPGRPSGSRRWPAPSARRRTRSRPAARGRRRRPSPASSSARG